MDLVKDALLVFGRIITILPLVLMITLTMGRRSIGELPVFDFLIIISLGAVVGADLSDPEIRHFHTVITVIGIGLLQMIISTISIKRRKFGKWITFEPIVVIKNGTILVGNVKKIRYSVDNILQMLREKGVFDLSEVELAIVEANGSLSVYKQSIKTPVTIEDLGIQKKEDGLSYPLIIEGKLYHEVLYDLQVDETWLYAELQKQGIEGIEEIFYASLSKDKKLHISLTNDVTHVYPLLHH